MELESLLEYLDQYLGVSGRPDYSTALNGLQVEGRNTVEKIAVAVDASVASIAEAIESGADLMIVHHGLFWSGLQPLVGRQVRRVKPLLDSGMGLYSCHLPLDAHWEVGNCAVLMRKLGAEPNERLGEYKGAPVGWWGSLAEPTDLDGLTARLQAATGTEPHVVAGGPERIELIGVITGGGSSYIDEAVGLDLDAFVTGEGPHHSHFDAVEAGIHLLLGGHYATETFGVQALAGHLEERFGLEWYFVDQPTGL